MKSTLVFVLVLSVLVGAVAASSFIAGTGSSSGSAIASSTVTTSGCSQPPGVTRVQLAAPSQFGAVTTYRLPKPLKAPNSITVASDGSVWFGEVGLRGVAHLFRNGTLLEYSWPSDTIGPGTNCLDILELWGIALWHGMVWTSDASNNQLIGLVPSNDTYRTVYTGNGSLPRYLAVDTMGRLWFTEASLRAQVGVLDSPSSPPRYFQVPAPAGEMTASVLIYNSSLAYVVTVNPENNTGGVFRFDPSANVPSFIALGSDRTLLGPYSAAIADGELWVSEHEASNVALYDRSSSSWSFFPTSVNPDVALTLPYYMVGNGSQLWFNEQTGNRVAVLSEGSLTEYNISSKSLTSSGIRNVLSIALQGPLLWFTEWTGNAVGYVNASTPLPFSVRLEGPAKVRVSPGSSTVVDLAVSGDSTVPLHLQYATSETHTSLPMNLRLTSNVSSIDGLSGTQTLRLTIAAAPNLPTGRYLVLATVTDGMVYRSVYITVDVG